MCAARLLARLLFLGSVVVRHFGRFILRDEFRVLIQPLLGPHKVILTVNSGVVGRSMCSFVSVIVHDGLRPCSFRSCEFIIHILYDKGMNKKEKFYKHLFLEAL